MCGIEAVQFDCALCSGNTFSSTARQAADRIWYFLCGMFDWLMRCMYSYASGHSLPYSPQVEARAQVPLNTHRCHSVSDRSKAATFGQQSLTTRAPWIPLSLPSAGLPDLSDVCPKLKEFGKAEGDTDAALRVDPRHVKSLQRRAVARNALGKHRAALGDLQTAAEIDPSSKQVARVL